MKMESFFGTDFSGVNIHANDNSATDMGALAYTQGNDVHFAPGQYNPQSQAGQELLGHELTHVVQQRQGRVQATTQQKGVGVNDDPGLEKEADDMGRKAAEGKGAEVAGKGNGVQMKDDDKLLSDLYDRSKGEKRSYENDSVTDQDRAVAYADKNFLEAYGDSKFASLLINRLGDSMRNIYNNIKDGQISAIEALENSMKEQHERQEMARACLISFIGILNAWLPLSAASVAKAEAQLTANISKSLPPNVTLKSVKIPAYANAIKKFGESSVRGPIVSTISSVNSLIKSKPASAKESIRIETSQLQDKTSFAIHGLVLEMSKNLTEADKHAITPDFIAELNSSLYKQVLGTIFPEYTEFINNHNISGIQNEAKTQILKNIVFNSGKVSKGVFSDSLEGNKNKDGSNMVNHAINAMGGEEAFASTLKNPYEFAFASLNSSLSHLGLEINTTNEIKTKASETDFLKSQKGFHLKLLSPDSFKEFLKDKEIVTENHYKPVSGATKEMKEKHASSTGFLYSSYTSNMFSYEDVNIDNIEVWISPSDQQSMMEGKIIDVKSFKLKFNTIGNSKITERTVTRIGRSFKNAGIYALNGRNEINVVF